MEQEEKYLIFDRPRSIDNGFLMYWNSNNHGYTADKKRAKLFSKAEALEIVSKYNSNKEMVRYEGEEENEWYEVI